MMVCVQLDASGGCRTLHALLGKECVCRSREVASGLVGYLYVYLLQMLVIPLKNI